MKQMKTEFVNLSGDLVGEILCRLDAEALSNCCCVCKTWYRIISDPSFAHLHRQFLLTNSNLVVVDRWWPHEICTGVEALSFTMFSHNNIAGRRMECAAEKDSIVTSRIYQNDDIGSGLLVMHRLTCNMMLLSSSQGPHLPNPRTGDLHTLPGYYSAYFGEHLTGYTYGYVASKTEYVLVAINSVDEQHLRPAKLSFTVGQACSGWKVMDALFPRDLRSFDGIIINNHVYWSSCGNLTSECKEFIVSMDLDSSDSNVFSVIKSPPFMPEIGLYFDDDYTALIDLKGSLAMVETNHMATTNTLLLWLLTDRSSSSWIKKFHINLRMILPALNPECAYPDLHEIIGLKSSKDGELIIRPNKYSYERSYYILNPETKTAKHLITPLPHPTFTIESHTRPYNVEAVFL